MKLFNLTVWSSSFIVLIITKLTLNYITLFDYNDVLWFFFFFYKMQTSEIMNNETKSQADMILNLLYDIVWIILQLVVSNIYARKRQSPENERSLSGFTGESQRTDYKQTWEVDNRIYFVIKN